MNKSIVKIAMLCLVILLSYFAPFPPAVAKTVPKINTVAVVSLAVNAVSLGFGSFGTTPRSTLISDALNDMLHDTEEALDRKWKVVKAAGFVNSAGYRKFAADNALAVFVPQINGQDMPLFTHLTRELESGFIPKERARGLCMTLDVDALVLIHSEWTTHAPPFIRTSKALTKNMFTFWYCNGTKVIKKQVNMPGKRVLGFAASRRTTVKAVNEETINEWRYSFNDALYETLVSF